jgi:HEAT repeat protein
MDEMKIYKRIVNHFKLHLIYIVVLYFSIIHNSYTQNVDTTEHHIPMPPEIQRGVEEGDYRFRTYPGMPEEERKKQREYQEKMQAEMLRRRARSDSLLKLSETASKTTEEINREMIEEDIRSYRPKVPLMLNKLKSSDRKSLTIEFLEKARDPRAIAPLIGILKNDSIATIRSDAAKALGTIADYETEYKDIVITPLKEALNDNSIGVKYSASRSLIKLGEASCTIPTLISIFKKEPKMFNQPIEVWVTKELCRSDLPKDKQFEIAQSMISKAREKALQLLIKIGSKEVIAELNNCLNSPDEWVRMNAEKAINKINEERKN